MRLLAVIFIRGQTILEYCPLPDRNIRNRSGDLLESNPIIHRKIGRREASTDDTGNNLGRNASDQHFGHSRAWWVSTVCKHPGTDPTSRSSQSYRSQSWGCGSAVE